MNYNLFDGRMSSLPVFVYTQYANQGNPPEAYLDRAWAAALTLILIVMALNLIARLVARFFAPSSAAEPNAPVRKPVSKRIEVRDLNVYYSKFLAVEGVSLEIEPRSVTAFIGPRAAASRRSSAPSTACTRSSPAHARRGEVLIDGNNLYDADVDPVLVRRQVGMVFQRPNPFPTMSIKENVLAGVKLNNKRISKSDADDLVEVAAGRETSGTRSRTASTAPARPVGGQQQRLCTRDRGRPRGHPHGRAVLGARPDLDARDRGPHRGAEAAVHDRDRDPQHAAGLARSATRRRSSTSRAPASPASSSSTTTTTIFSNPSVQATEDYVSGRFG